jgi:serine phosphatase RsbU (regulator of sigma subunit)
MNRNLQILLTLGLMGIFQLGFWSFTLLSKRYINNELTKQIVADNKAIAEQMVTMFSKIGLTSENSETNTVLQDLCGKIKLPNAGFFCAIDKSGNLIAAPGLRPGMSMSFNPVLQDLNNKAKEFKITELSPDTIFLGYAFFRDKNRCDLVASYPLGNKLRLFVHQDTAFIKERSWESVKPLILWGFLVTIIVGGLARQALRKIATLYETRIDKNSAELRAVTEKYEGSLAENKRMDELMQHQNIESAKYDNTLMVYSKNIADTVQYAKKVQKAIFSKSKIENGIIADSFIISIPRDEVGGDFYWSHKKDNLTFIVTADCTGHGVPGAFMGLLGISLLNEIVIEKKIKDTGIILEYLSKSIIDSHIHESKSAILDNIELALCVIDHTSHNMEFAGANMPVLCIRGNELIELKPDRMRIGGINKNENEFTNQTLLLQAEDVLYLFSDGFYNQFGGSQGRKFLLKNFKNLLLEIKDLSMQEQKNILQHSFVEWKGNYPQVDDITVIGLKIN